MLKLKQGRMDGNLRIADIYEMDLWDEDYMNMEVQAFIHIHKNGNGNFQFGLVTGQMVGRIADGNNAIWYEFT